MKTDNSTSSPVHDVPEAGPGLTTLDPSAAYITIINTYVVAPERAEALLDFLVRATNEAIRYVPGFVSANLHVNFDRTQVVNYAQWKSREVIAAARENPKSWRSCASSFRSRTVSRRSCTSCGNQSRRPDK